MHNAANEHKYSHENRQHEVVHDPIVAEADEANQAAAWNALQTVLAAGEVRLQTDEKHELSQRQSDHRKINSLTAYRDRADHQTEQQGHCNAAEYSRNRSPTLNRHQPSRGICR